MSITASMRKLLDEEGTVDKLAKAILSQAARGNGSAIKQVLDRIDGPVVNKEPIIASKDFVDACIDAAIDAHCMDEAAFTAWMASLEKILTSRFRHTTLAEERYIERRC